MRAQSLLEQALEERLRNLRYMSQHGKGEKNIWFTKLWLNGKQCVLFVLWAVCCYCMLCNVNADRSMNISQARKEKKIGFTLSHKHQPKPINAVICLEADEGIKAAVERK